MRVAIIHYWWLTNRGGEAVVTELLKIYPKADLFMHVYDKTIVDTALNKFFKGRVHLSFISKLPFAKTLYQKYLVFMPIALEQFDLSNYDLIISSESGPSKGVITRPDSLHICYCHSPMRYIWDLYHDYLRNAGFFIKLFFPWISYRLRIWDKISADRVDFFIANSTFVAKRINKYYRRDSEVIFPPVNVTVFDHSKERSDFYLYLGHLVHYKRVDLAIQAFNELNLPLIIIGDGPMLQELKLKSKSNIKFLEHQPFEVVKTHLELCKSVIFPGLEDFGIVPVEAMAAGAPVIAYGKGGVLDTVVNGVTGLIFKEQSKDSLIDAVRILESKKYKFDSKKLKNHAMKFDRLVFKKKILKVINEKKHKFNF